MIVLFAGTTEGRELSQWMSSKMIRHIVCVATEYGEKIMKGQGTGEYMELHEGRMDSEGMYDLIKSEGAKLVIDSTHPYAVEAGRNIKNAAERAGAEYIRVERAAMERSDYKKISYFNNAGECAEYLAGKAGNILLTTGSKDLSAYSQDSELRKRLFVRVLPGKESLEACENCGISGRQIIAMQGPFTEEMNLAMIRQFDIAFIVSKDSGKAGGIQEKIQAAEASGIEMCMIEGKKEEGSGISIAAAKNYIEKNCLSGKPRKISIISCGMAGPGSITKAAQAALSEAEIVFGAKRLLEAMDVRKPSHPYYLAKDIIPELEKTSADAAVMFSGDAGFHSGANKFVKALKNEIEAGKLNADIQIYAGVSSPAALAAEFGICWDDAELISLHGACGADQISRLIEAVKHSSKIFALLSGLQDLREIGKALQNASLDHCRVLAGRNLGSDVAGVFELTAQECEHISEEGLYSIFVINDRPQARHVSAGISDDEFIRGSVPMTKESIRTLSISKLRLREDSIVYDIGSGTGSVSVEMALLSPQIKVYAIERKSEAVELSKENIKKFGLRNIEVTEAEAPEGLGSLPVPTHAFIGGSGGKLKETIKKLLEMNPSVRIVINAVTLETLKELTDIETIFDIEDFEMICISASKSRKLGAYHMMQSENPVWICSFQGTVK